MSALESEAAAADPLSVEAIRAALAGEIEAVPVTWGYRLGLLLVALATVLLPVLYVALIVLAGWGVYLHAVHNAWLLSGRGGGLGRLLAYVGPIVAGAVVVFFLLKPLLARSARRHSDVEVDGAGHPLLFELVRGICRAVGAPMPRRVIVDCQVNASASLRRGLASFLGQDLQLTIGLPLVTGLTLRQLAGVLAHEMGHFAQGSGMRLTYLVRSVNAWLARVVYERDAWDQKLVDLSREADYRLAVVLWVARFGVWLSRRVLWVLMMAGHAIGTLMMRQMEYDADRYEARLAGSAVFASTALRMRVLNAGWMKATSVLSASYVERRLADDFPTLVAAAADSFPEDLRRQIESPEASPASAGVFDTHPPDAARIESAERERSPGLFRLEGPAAGLVPGLEALARRATESFYSEEQEIDLSEVRLIPTAEVLAREAGARNDERARRAYFGELVSTVRPLAVGPGLPAAASPEEALAALRQCRAETERLRAPAEQAAERMIAAHGKVMAARGAGAVLTAGFRVDPAAVGMEVSEASAAEAVATRALDERRSADQALGPAREALGRRLTAALSLLEAAPVAARLEQAAQRAREADGLLRALHAMGTQAPAIAALAEAHATLTPLLALDTDDDAAAERRYRHVIGPLQTLHQVLERVLAALEAARYPFEHTQGSLSLRAFLETDMPPRTDNAFTAYLRAEHALARLQMLHSRALGRLASIALAVEEAALAEP